MMIKKTIIYLFIWASSAFFLTGGQETAAALESPVQKAGAGSGITILDGINGFYCNPALLNKTKLYRLSASYAGNRYIVDTWFHNLAVTYKPFDFFTGGAGFSFFSSGDMTTMETGLASQGGSLKLDSDGYITAGNAASVFRMQDIMISLAGSFSPDLNIPFGFDTGVVLKNNFSGVLEERSWALLLDAGALFTIKFPKPLRVPASPFFVPSKIAVVMNNFGFQTSYLDANKANLADFTLNGGFSFTPPPLTPIYRFSYGFEMSHKLTLKHHNEHFFTIKNLFEIYARTGVAWNISDRSFKMGTGVYLQKSFKNIPMEIGYTLNWENFGGFTHSFSYSASFDIIPVELAVGTVLKKVEKMLDERKYEKAYKYVQDNERKIGYTRLKETKKRIEYLIVEEKDLFFLSSEEESAIENDTSVSDNYEKQNE